MKLNKTLINLEKSNNSFFNIPKDVWVNHDLLKIGMELKSIIPTTYDSTGLKNIKINKEFDGKFVFRNQIPNIKPSKTLIYFFYFH